MGGVGSATNTQLPDSDAAEYLNIGIAWYQSLMDEVDPMFMVKKFSFTATGSSSYPIGPGSPLIGMADFRDIRAVINAPVKYKLIPSEEGMIGTGNTFSNYPLVCVVKDAGTLENAYSLFFPTAFTPVGTTEIIYSFYVPPFTSTTLVNTVPMAPSYTPILELYMAFLMLAKFPSDAARREQVLLLLRAQPIPNTRKVIGETGAFERMYQDVIGVRQPVTAPPA
jgi:hypothetical protein